MKAALKNDISRLGKNDTLVLFADEDNVNNLTGFKIPGSEYVAGADLSNFKGKSSELYFIKLENKPGVLLCGLGNLKKYSDDSIRNSSAAAVKFCITKKMKKISVMAPEVKEKKSSDILRLVAEGALLSNYAFNKYKSDNDLEIPLETIDFYTPGKEDQSIVKDMEILAENTMQCRDLVNDTTDAVNPVSFAELAKGIADAAGLKCTVFEKKDIEKKKMGLLLAVNRGSIVPPRVVVLEYKGDPGSKKVFGLVGKGITFDSGGMDLKPASSMETMKCDMAGAATVLYTMKSLAELKVKKNVAAVLPLTENMLSSSAFRPGDIFIGYSGKSVEIGNTDAEGRLILADALAYMEKEIKPDVIVDLATLTGSCVLTFGETVAGYLSTDDNISAALEVSSIKTGEKVWRLPLFEDYDDRMKSDIADLNNMSSEKNAGAIASAIFLRNFVEKTPWAHIDIAGTAFYSKARGYRPKNATGFGLRLVVDLIQNWN
ncbi:MAG TPA: leucyl aminopeptidase [Spirochaetota bacterium]|nr:leucyl aminopeptidase [Spirochaetota bacterium]